MVIFSIILIITYRSTIANTSLARLIAKCTGLVLYLRETLGVMLRESNLSSVTLATIKRC